jgi:hypothetical protein
MNEVSDGHAEIFSGRKAIASAAMTRRQALEPAPQGERSRREVEHFYAGALSPPAR